MQKTTFQGLENVVKCVKAHLKHIQSLADNVIECARYLIKEIELKLPRSYIDCDIINLKEITTKSNAMYTTYTN